MIKFKNGTNNQTARIVVKSIFGAIFGISAIAMAAAGVVMGLLFLIPAAAFIVWAVWDYKH